MKTFTYICPMNDQLLVLVSEAENAEEARRKGGTPPILHETALPVLVLDGDFRGHEMARNCLREVSYFLSGASHLSETEMADYVGRALSAFEGIER